MRTARGGAAEQKKRPNGSAPSLVQDSRFARLHTDPRFQRFPSAKNKVKVDERFKGMFADKEFRVAPRVDKYGRKMGGKGEDGLMHKFYELEDDEDGEALGEEEDDEALLALHGDEDEGALAAPGEKGDRPRRKFVDRARGIGVSDESSSESSSDDDERDELAEVEGEEEGVLAQWLDGAGADGALPGSDDDGEQLDAPTHRLAVLNCDWDNVSAADIYVLLSSFLPAGGQVVSVSVFPSRFGRERMALEAVSGPQLGYAPAQPQPEAAAPVERAHDPRSKASRKRARERGEDGIAEYDEQKLREYELSKLRYYYAVAQFDSAHSAAAVYNECAGLEVEASSMVLECRYVPDEMDFDEEEPLLRDRATEAPPNYTSPTFATKALQQSKVELTWDADDSARSKVLRRDFAKLKKAGELREDDFKAYLASSSSEDEDADDGEAVGRRRQAYQQLIAGARAATDEDGGGKGGRRGAGKRGKEGADGGAEGDVEITFMPQLEQQLGAGRKEETVWEARQRRRREKRQAARAGGAHAQGAQAAVGAGDDFSHYADDEDGDGLPDGADDDFFVAADGDEGDVAGGGPREGKGGRAAKGKAGKRRRKDEPELTPAEEAAAAKRKAELELLMLGDGMGAGGPASGSNGGFWGDGLGGGLGGEERHFDLQALLKQAKGSSRRKGKGKRAPDEAAADGAGGGFELDVSDPRFAAISASADFAIDPTDAKYRKTLGALKPQRGLRTPGAELSPPSLAFSHVAPRCCARRHGEPAQEREHGWLAPLRQGGQAQQPD